MTTITNIAHWLRDEVTICKIHLVAKHILITSSKKVLLSFDDARHAWAHSMKLQITSD